MTFWLAVKRFISVAWLIAAPIVIIVLFFGQFLLLALALFLAGLAFGPDAAQGVEAFAYGVILLEAALLILAVLFVPFYAFYSYVKSKRQ